jgi:hypothetical protein
LTTQEDRITTTITPFSNSNHRVTTRKKPKLEIPHVVQKNDQSIFSNTIQINKHALQLRLRQTIKHYHKTIQPFESSSNVLTIQQFESLRLYYELINTTQNILILMSQNRTTDLDTLLRKVIEKYVYLHVISVNTHQAQSLHLKVGTSLCKRRNYTDSTGNLTEEQNNLSNINRLKRLDAKYKAGFVEEANPDRWFNLNGKTTCMEKLIEANNIDHRFALLYALMSQDVHSVKTKTTVKQLLNADLYDQYEGEPELIILETLNTILNESDRLISRLF